MATITAGSSKTFTAQVDNSSFVVIAPGGSIGQVDDQNGNIQPIGPNGTRRTFGPLNELQSITVSMQIGNASVELNGWSGGIPITAETNSTGQTALDDPSRAAVQAVRVVSLPARAQALIPGVPVIISGGRAQLGCDPVTLVPMDPRAGATQYYVDVVNGVDANNGSTWALAFKSIYKATQAGNAAAVPYTVNIAAGWYPRANGFSNNGAGVTPTQSCVFRGIGGQVICHTGNALTWVLDSGTTYSTARSNTKRVLDLAAFDADGDYNELTLAASLAACRAAPGTWYSDGTTLYVNRTDGAVVSDANTLALLTTISGIIGTNSGNMHLFNITQMGGSSGCFQIQNNTTGKTYAENCKFNFSTSSTYIDNVVGLDSALVVMNKCVAAKSQKDGFNYHNGGSVAPKAVHIDCLGYGNGVVTTSNSNNGTTIHDAGVLLDLNGRYFKNYGGDYAHANASTIAVGVCTQTYGSYGDLDRPSGITRPGSGFVALSGSTIYKYDCVGADQVDGGGSIITA